MGEKSFFAGSLAPNFGNLAKHGNTLSVCEREVNVLGLRTELLTVQGTVLLQDNVHHHFKEDLAQADAK